MTYQTPEERSMGLMSAMCPHLTNSIGVPERRYMCKKCVAAEIRAAIEAERKTWTREALQKVEDATLESAAQRIRTLSFAYDTKRHMGLPDPCAALDEATEKVLALKSSGQRQRNEK